MNKDLKELIELKQYVDSLIEEVILEEVKSSKITKAGHLAHSLAVSPIGGVAGYLKRKNTDEKILEYLRNNPDTTIEDVQELRNKARKKQRKNENIGSAIHGALAGTVAIPVPVLGTGIGATAGYIASKIAHGTGNIIRKTDTGKRSELDTNKRFLKAAAEERNAGIKTKPNKEKLDNIKF